MRRAGPTLDAAAFAALMAPFAPFEPRPLVAVAVSGGADSLGLTLLADAWARERGGRIVALTVDHRLRPGSAEEAARVGAWLAARRIEHRILVREGLPPPRNRQAAAREARYALLDAWCRANSCLHLLVAHTEEDQAETLLLRLGRGSGVAGLAAMPGITELAHCRVLRPLLTVPRAALRDFLAAEGQDWIEDPSNRDPAFARVRIRQAAPSLAAAGLTTATLAATAARLGRARAAIESAAGGLAARAVTLHPAGFARLDAAALAAAPTEVALRLLGELLAAVGGAAYTPRLERLERLLRHLGEPRGRTLAGCRVLPRRGGLLVCREPAATAPPVPCPPGAETRWDGRFVVSVEGGAAGLAIGALGAVRPPAPLLARLPPPVRASLPALWDDSGLAGVPLLGFWRDPAVAARAGMVTCRFRPRRSLTAAGFAVVWRARHLI